MATEKSTGFQIKNPQYNRSGELIAFDGIKLVDNKLDKTDKGSMDRVAWIQKLKRVSEYTGSAAPRVVVDGKEYPLSYKFFTSQERDTYNEYRKGHSSGGSGSSTKIPEDVLQEFLALKGLSKKAQEFLESCKPKDPKREKLIKSLMDIGLSRESAEKQADSVIKAQQKD